MSRDARSSRYAEVTRRFRELATPVIGSARVPQMSRYTQHGTTSCLLHCEAVAFYSLLLARTFHLRVDEPSLVRGALLHDYFLYDWHDPDPSHRLSGFRHPYIALRNAEQDFTLTSIERDLIVRHMFPLVPLPPVHREGFLVCLVDKCCSLHETLTSSGYPSSVRVCASLS